MRLMIKKGDYVRLMIISKKINTKNLEAKELFDLKILYNSYMIDLHIREKSHLEVKF